MKPDSIRITFHFEAGDALAKIRGAREELEETLEALTELEDNMRALAPMADDTQAVDGDELSDSTCGTCHADPCWCEPGELKAAHSGF